MCRSSLPLSRPRQRKTSSRSGELSAAPQRFGFVQFDFPGALGLSDGRYLAPDRRVLVTELLGAPPRRRRRPGRRPGTAADQPTELPMTRATAIRSDQPFGDESEAADWVRQVSGDPDLAQEEAEAAIGLVNRALQAAAIAEADPYIGPRRATQAVAIRVGHGGGEELADGRFSQAVGIDLEVGKRRRRRSDGVGSQERMAAIFGGREQADLCEGLILRARLELDADREAEAALCLSHAVPVLLRELDGALSDPGHSEDMAELRRRRPQVSRIADRYLGGAAGVVTGGAVGAGGSGDGVAGGPAGEDGASQSGSEAQGTLTEALTLAERVLRRRRILRG